MTRIKKALTLIAMISMLTVGGGNLCAQGVGYPASITVSPSSSFQHIFYSEDSYNDRNGFGLGLGLSYDHFIKNKFALGLEGSYEYFLYQNFFNYQDFKVQATGKLQLGKYKPSSDIKLFFTAGAGCDMVQRNDGDFGVYPLFNLGLETLIMCSDSYDTVLGLNTGLTIQNGSMVLQVEARVGIRSYFVQPATGEKEKQ